MDPITLAGAYQSLKATKEILTSLFDAKVDAEIRPKLLEAQAKIGEVQDSLFLLREKLAELQQERDQLRQDLSSLQAWEATSSKYDLHRTVGSAVVYRFKLQPEHFACPSCFNKREVHILQDRRVTSGTYRCTGCGCDFPVDHVKPIMF